MNKVKSPVFAKAKTGKQKSKVYFYYVLLIFLIFFVSLNIYFSQSVSSLYGRVMNEKQEDVVEFVKKIRFTPQFSFFLDINKKIYGDNFEKDVFVQEAQKKEQINQLGSALEKNPKARDVLVTLSRLYKELGNEIKAKEYLEKAKEIDPNIE